VLATLVGATLQHPTFLTVHQDVMYTVSQKNHCFATFDFQKKQDTCGNIIKVLWISLLSIFREFSYDYGCERILKICSHFPKLW